MLLTEILNEVPDPRGYNAVHDLTDVLFVALAAVLCGAVHCTEMAFFAETRLELLRQFVPLKEGAPSHDTFTRVLGALDPQAFPGRLSIGSWWRSATRPGPTLRGQGGGGWQELAAGLRQGPLATRAAAGGDRLRLRDLPRAWSQVVAQTGGEAQAAIAALELLSAEAAAS